MARTAVGEPANPALSNIDADRKSVVRAARDLLTLLSPPVGYFGRARWLLLVANLALTLLALALLGFAGTNIWPLRLAGGLALAGHFAWLLFAYRRGSFSPPVLPLEAPLLLLASVGLGGQQGATLGLIYLIVILRALYGTTVMHMLVVAVFCLCLLASNLLTGSEVSAILSAQISLQAIGLLVTGGVVQLLAGALANQERTMTRQNDLAATSVALLAAETPDSVYAAALQAIARMLGDTPVSRTGIMVGSAEQMSLVASSRRVEQDELWVDPRKLPASALAALKEGNPVPLDSTQLKRNPLGFFAGESTKLLIVPLVIDKLLGGAILVSSDVLVPVERREAMADAAKLIARAVARALQGQDKQVMASEERILALVQSSSDMVTILGADGTIRYQSPSIERMLGYDVELLIGTRLADIVHPEERKKFDDFMEKANQSPGQSVGIECRIRQWDGAWRYMASVGTNLLHDPAVRGILMSSRDVTERRTLETELDHLAFHDPLTHLPNRVKFMARLQEALERLDRSYRTLAVLFLDLDNFKVINDSLGHHAGDQLLKSVAERLTSLLPVEAIAARLGGDEFTILLDNIEDQTVGAVVAEEIQRHLQMPFTLNSREVYVTTSIGIAISTSPQDRPDSLLRNADVAMYAAKNKGKAGYAVFDPDMNKRMMERLNLQAELRHALDRDEFRVYYQPVVELSTGRILEVEALVRWQHPTRGLVSPGQFIPMAEETGLIVTLGTWVLEQACKQIRSWQTHLPGQPMLTVGVNLSAKQLQQLTLVDLVAQTLKNSDLDPEQLKLEITESLAMEDAEATRSILSQLKALGVKLAIDDFGTGYSSLSYLKRFPVDTLKIDRSFVDGLGNNTEDTAIVQTIIGVAKNLGLKVTAEGIETSQQVRHLRSMNCNLGQGYFFSRPMSSQDFGLLLVNAARKGLVVGSDETARLDASILPQGLLV